METEAPGVTCPDCLAFAWRHQGFEVAADGPVFRAEPVQDEAEDMPWHCASCGHELQDEQLTTALDRVQEAHWA